MSVNVDLRYIAWCAGIGLVAGQVPGFLHGPVPEKFAILHIDGSAVWAWYLARSLIGLWVGLVAVPRAWFVRGPLCGLLVLLPLTLVSRAMPACGYPCMFWNLMTAAMTGFVVAGLALLITGRSSAVD